MNSIQQPTLPGSLFLSLCKGMKSAARSSYAWKALKPFTGGARPRPPLGSLQRSPDPQSVGKGLLPSHFPPSVAWRHTARPSPASSLKVTDRSSQYASPHLWNQLPFSLREPVSPLYAYLNPSFCSPFSPSITPSLFHSKLKTYLFGKSFPP